MTAWDSAYVRSKYRVNMAFQESIYFPAKDCKRLLVFFSTMGKNRYDRYSWFWQEDEDWSETAYLFLKDDSFHYFLGTEGASTSQAYRQIIEHHVAKLGLKNENVFSVGTSMGGYAAIYFAAYLGFNGCIVASPQVDYSGTRAANAVWERYIREMGSNWYDLTDFMHRFSRMPNIYIEYGNFVPDKTQAERLLKSIERASDSLIVARKTDWTAHNGNPELSKETIEAAVSLFENCDFPPILTEGLS